MRSRLLLFAVVAAALLLSTGADCGKKLSPPEFVRLPDTFWTDVTLLTSLVSAGQTFDSARYIVDWGDGVDTTGASFGPDDTAHVQHAWTDTSRYEVRARTLTTGARQRLSAWSAPETVQVIPFIPNSAPVIDSVGVPLQARPNEPCTLVVYAHDPDGDSLRVEVDFSGSDTTTGFAPSPCTVRITHVFTQNETTNVIVWACDTKGTKSAPDTVWMPVGSAGVVTWYWWSNDEDRHALTTSAIVAVDPDGEEVIMAGCKGDYKFYSVRTSNGRDKRNAATRWPEWVFTGHPGLANGHIIVGSDEGELYALELDGLGRAWMWPGKPAEESLTYVEWGAPAFNGANIYIGHDDDSLVLFQDSGLQCTRLAAYGCNAAVIDAPVIDATGNVIFGTDSGYLYKMGPELDTVFWRSHLLAKGEIHNPMVGGDGTIYCASESSRLHAIDPETGVPYWTVVLDGKGFRPALSQSALFIGTWTGKAYSINPATGNVNWQIPLSQSGRFNTAPVVAANGYVYFQSDKDVLYCVNQSDGTVIWECDCPSWLPPAGGGNPHQPKRTGLHDFPPNPTITAGGNIIVVGLDALYSVAGYPEGPLDPLAPWPKWQHDLYNTGKAGGGR